MAHRVRLVPRIDRVEYSNGTVIVTNEHGWSMHNFRTNRWWSPRLSLFDRLRMRLVFWLCGDNWL